MSKKKGIVIGIDLGTTNSVAAVFEADLTCRIILNPDGEPLTPSAVNLQDEEKPIVGRAAVHQSAYAPEYTARLFKRLMGVCDADGHSIPAYIHPDSSKGYSPEELSSFIIRDIVKGVEAATAQKVIGVVITAPAYFDATAREATQRAGELAGVKVRRIISEPTAGGIAFGLDREAKGTFAIYDFGGGTFDVSVLKIENEDYEILATDGDRNLGGSDFDNLLVEHAQSAFKEEHGIEITPESDLIAFQDVVDKCETAKKTLSRSETASFMMSSQGKRLVIEITRAEFEALIAPIVERTREITQRVLTAAGLQTDDIDAPILVGGSTRIPIVRDMLSKMFGKPARTDINPDEAVAMGAAIFAAKIAGEQGLSVVDSEGRNVLPPPIREITDVTAHSLGCLAVNNGVERNTVIIPANSKLPAEKSEEFGVEHPDQTAVKVKITNGADYADPADCKIYGEIVLDGLSRRSPDKNSIRVTYGLTVDATLDITITDLVSGKSVNDVRRGFDDLLGGTSA